MGTLNTRIILFFGTINKKPFDLTLNKKLISFKHYIVLITTVLPLTKFSLMTMASSDRSQVFKNFKIIRARTKKKKKKRGTAI